MSAIRVTESTGSLGTIQISDGSGDFLSGSLVAGTNVTIANNGSGSFTINAAAGSGGSTIGDAEDGDYTDGLFIDFENITPIGTAVDRFNEILKALAPSPAPPLDDINTNDSGFDARLSFGTSNNQSSASPAYHSVLGTAGIGSAVDAGVEYARTGDKRIGIFTALRDINGHLNDDVAYNSQGGGQQNFPAKSFGNADQGTIFLEVNGSNIASASLTDPAVGTGVAGSGTDDARVNSNGSGFLNISAVTNGKFSNGNAFATFKHRTGEYIVKPADQRLGWNYARVRHVIGSSTTDTNYIEWVNDTDSNNITASGNSITFAGGGSIHLSGVEYFQNGTVTYKTRVNNAYKYVYRNTDTINFTTSPGGIGFSLTNRTKADFPFGSGDTQNKILHLTASDSITPTTHLNGTLSANVSVSHPNSSKNLSNGGASTVSGILIYNRAANSSNTSEDFVDENFRIQSGSYNTQASVVDAANDWNSSIFITASNGGHSNGLQVYDGNLKSPTQTLNGGNFSAFANGPSQNPDYSGQNNASNLRTFYRYFRNGGSVEHDISLDMNGSGAIVAANQALDNTKVHVFVKIPEVTGWMDVGSQFVLGATGDGAGLYIDNEFLDFAGNLAAGSNTNYLNFGTSSIASNAYIVLKVVAKETWTGNLSDITVDFGAGQGTVNAVPDLSNIGSNNTGVAAKLSFDDAKTIPDYTPVATTAGGSDVNLNDEYAVSGNRRGVFAGNATLTGHLNDNVTAAGNSYKDNSFSDANLGTLSLEVNGQIKHAVELTGSFNLVGNGIPGVSTVNGTSFNSNGSGFDKLSFWEPGKFSGNNKPVPRYSEIFRVSEYKIHPDDQRQGFNYARVIHTVGGTPRNTNYIEWVNDVSGSSDDIAFSNLEAKKFGDNNFFHLSGVKYFVSPTGSFGVAVDKIYTNVYSGESNAIRIQNHSGISSSTATDIAQNGIGVTNTTKGSQGNSVALASLLNSADTEKQLLHVTASCAVSHIKSLSGSFVAGGDSNKSASLRFNFKHPLKNASGKATNVASATNFLIFSATDNSTQVNEYFNGEQFRIQSGSYASQAAVTSTANNWSSTGSLNDNSSFPGYYTGLMVYDSKLISPIKGGAAGNFRNKHEASAAGPFEGPDGNVDYSGVAGVREYFRGFVNPTTDNLKNFAITFYGDAKLVGRTGANSGTLGLNNHIFVDLKIPGKIEFVDLGKDFAGGAGSTPGQEGDGALNGSPIVNGGVIGNSGTQFEVQTHATVEGTGTGPDYFVLRISAHKDWIGYINQIDIRWSAT